jgi:ribosome-associated protein
VIHDAPLRRLLQAEADFQAVRAQGPGGQNVNKVSNAAQLRFDIRASSLPEPLKARLLGRADQRISADGVIVIKAQQHRSLTLNRAEALQRLMDMVQAAQQVPRTRHATRPTLASVQRRLLGKAQHGRLKALRGARPGVD